MLHIAIAGVFLLMVLTPCVVALRNGRDEYEGTSLPREQHTDHGDRATIPAAPRESTPSAMAIAAHVALGKAVAAFSGARRSLWLKTTSLPAPARAQSIELPVRRTSTEVLAALVRDTAARADAAADAAEAAEYAFAAAAHEASWARQEALLAQEAYLQDALHAESGYPNCFDEEDHAGESRARFTEMPFSFQSAQSDRAA